MCAQTKSQHRVICNSAFRMLPVIAMMLSSAFVPAKADARESSSEAVVSDKVMQEFIDSAVDKHGLDPAYIKSVVAKAQKNKTVLEAIARPWEAKPWHQYHPIFLTEKRLNKGVEFWKTHKETLKRAEEELGVPAHIIVAIIGVETYYGSYKGKYSVLDALYSLGFYYPPRSDFFKRELAQYLKLSQEEQWDPLAQKGSYAGAMGWGQFISSSYRHYSIDFDGDNKRDLLNNPVDAIGSVANYFKMHKWRAGEPVAYRATTENEKLVSKELKIEHTWQDLESSGVKLKDGNIDLPADTPAKLMALEQPEGPEYWTVLHNFYVITRYNHSPLYAMVVFQLSESLKAEMESI